MIRLSPGGVAQLGEHLLCKQGVVGSIPIISTTTQGAVTAKRCTIRRFPLGSLPRGVQTCMCFATNALWQVNMVLVRLWTCWW